MICKTELQECIAAFHSNVYICSYSVCILVASRQEKGNLTSFRREIQRDMSPKKRGNYGCVSWKWMRMTGENRIRY